ncbi:MAG: carboxypeptidase regulatory-like domain-containing protein, partial [Acidobacteria bacterium]|nr:carboxypeptidase regulatory-like domain-containing protein [Acidobacteriota bacterium]
MVSISKLTLVMLVSTAAAGVGLAQRTTSTFAGIVQDSTGAVLPGAEAELINEGTSAPLERVTNETGEFVFDFVPVGS